LLGEGEQLFSNRWRDSLRDRLEDFTKEPRAIEIFRVDQSPREGRGGLFATHQRLRDDLGAVAILIEERLDERLRRRRLSAEICRGEANALDIRVAEQFFETRERGRRKRERAERVKGGVRERAIARLGRFDER